MNTSNREKASRSSELLSVALIAVFLVAARTSGSVFTWDAGGDAFTYTDGANWGGSAPANSPATEIKFDNTGSGGTVINLDANRTVGKINFSSGNTAYTIISIDNKSFFLGSSGIVNDTSATQEIDANITLISFQTWAANSGALILGGTVGIGTKTLNLSGSQDVTFGGPITGSGSGSVALNGSGTVTFGASSTFNGPVAVNSGTLTLAADAATGTGSIILGGGQLKTSGSRAVGNAVSGTGSINVPTSDVLTLSGPVSGTLTKIGGGILELTGNNNTFSSLRLDSGSVVLGGTGAVLPSSATLAFNGGQFSLRNHIETAGVLSVLNGGTINLQPDATHGSLTFASASWTAGTLTIKGWSGVANLTTPSTPGTDDRIFFSSTPGSDFLSHVNFEGYPSGGKMLSNELVPVPEPRYHAVIIGLGLIALAARRRLQRSRV
jgi:autotransporter-associated beta strand protein